MLEIRDANGNTCILFNGEWYEVSAAFHQEIETAFKGIVSANPIVANSAARNEKELLDELKSRPDLLLLDQKKASPQGATRANIEPCDFLSHNRQFIHLKHGKSSALLSHLWNQGLVSATSLIEDEKFRKDLIKVTKQAQKETNKSNFDSLLPKPAGKVDAASYIVVFGILKEAGRKSGTVDIPFFSKIALKTIAQRISSMSFDVEVHLIQKV